MESSCSLVSSLAKMQILSKQWNLTKQTIGFVPTMGCLHKGHLSLIKEARRRADKVVVSIFVNPLQFGPKEDFKTYPRTFEQDFQLCEAAGVDVIFHPQATRFFSRQFRTSLDGGEIARKYCGRSRPGHFNGVLTVVQILLNLVKPTFSFFGEKDFQQLFLIQQMCRDFWLPVEIVPMPIVREENGLAMSSRNTYLNAEQKEKATCLFRAISSVQNAVKNGHTKTDELLRLASSFILQTPGAVLDYAHFVDLKNLMPAGDDLKAPTRLLLAAYIGDSPRVRLIDNGLIIV